MNAPDRARATSARGARARILDAVFGDVVGLVPGEPTPSARTWRNDARRSGVIVAGGAGQRRRRRRLRGGRRRRVRRHRRAAAGDGLRRRPRRRRRPSGRAGAAPRPHHGAVGRATSRSCSASPTRRRRSRRRWCPAASSPTASASATSCSPRRPSTSRTAFLTDGLGLAQSDWLEMELAAGHRARGALLPLQRAPPHRRAGQGAVRAAADAAPRDVRDERARRRRRRVRPRCGRPTCRSRTASAATTTTGCSASTCRRPAGFQVEVGHGAQVVADDWDDNRRYDRISAWGHQPLRPA